MAEQVLHANLAAGRWHTLTLADQLGNIGSDVGRAIRAKEQDKGVRLQGTRSPSGRPQQFWQVETFE